MIKSIIGGLAMAIATTAGGVDFVQVWDKTFPKSGNVEHSKVTFKNRPLWHYACRRRVQAGGRAAANNRRRRTGKGHQADIIVAATLLQAAGVTTKAHGKYERK